MVKKILLIGGAVAVGFWLFVLPALADTATFYPDTHIETESMDFYMSGSDSTWRGLRSAVTGTVFEAPTSQLIVNISDDGGGTLESRRIVLIFNTDPLPDDAIITSAVVELYGISTKNEDDDGDDWTSLVEVQTTSNIVGTASDIGGFSFFPISNKIDIGDAVTGGYNTYTLKEQYFDLIEVDGVTKFGVMEGHESLNNSIGSGTNNRVTYTSIDNAAGGEEPRLVVTYTTQGGISLDGSGSLLLLSSACNQFDTGTGYSVCTQWDTHIEIQAVEFAIRAINKSLFQLSLIVVLILIIFRLLLSVCRWFFYIITQR